MDILRGSVGVPYKPHCDLSLAFSS